MSASDYITKYGVMHRDPYSTHDDSDLTIARIAEYCVAQDVRRVEKVGTWLQWNGYYWKETDNAAPILDDLADVVERQIQNLYLRRNTQPLAFFQEFSQWMNFPADADQEKKVEAFEGVIKKEKAIASKLKSDAGRNSIMRIVGSHMTIDNDSLDANFNKIVFRNGYFDCETSQFLDNVKSQYATLCINIDYDTPNESSRENVKAYLHDLGFDDETLEYIQRAFGYAMTGQGNEKLFFWFRGEGNTSKSTLINLVAECVDMYAYSTSADMWCERKNTASGHSEETAVLRGRRFVLADEFQKKVRLNGAVLKKMSAGSGKLSASRKGEKSFLFQPRFGLFFASNFDCSVDQGDSAFMNRLATVTFNKVIDPKVKDKRFIQNFLNRDQNRLAFIEWLLEGAHKYCLTGIGTEPQHVKDSREAFTAGQISVDDQLVELLQVDSKAVDNKAVTLTAIMESLNNLQKSTRQLLTFTKKDVTDTVKRRFGIDLTTDHGHTGFQGLSLKNTYSQSRRRSTAWDPQLDWGYQGEYEDSPN